MSCPENSHYELCADPCPVTCSGPATTSSCDQSCTEGCACNNGFVFSGDQCVSRSQCGCVHMGQYYKRDEVFYPDDKCDEQCTCKEAGYITCTAFACGPNEECSLVDGIQSCHPVGSGTCNAIGDHHCHTLDGYHYDFQGGCIYTLAKPCGGNKNLTDFAVNVKNGKFVNGRGTVPVLVTLEVYGHTFTLTHQKSGVILVDGVQYHLPYNLEKGKVSAIEHGATCIVRTKFHLELQYDFVYKARVSVPGNYRGQMCGLCGNFNGNNVDEFLLPDGQFTTDVNEFTSAWTVQEDESCDPVTCGSLGNPCVTCIEKKLDIFKNKDYCGFLTDADGPLRDCHSSIKPDVYFENCVYDLCAADGDSKTLCHNIQSYVADCQAAGVTVRPWRSNSFCPFDCPPNSTYSMCSDTCECSCVGLVDPMDCPELCDEGCDCDEDFFFDGEQCVPMDRCGCYENGRYYPMDLVFLTGGCSRSCTCSRTGVLLCEHHSCADDEKCTNEDGVIKCINTDPCKAKKCREKEDCKLIDEKAQCIPQFTSSCWGWGDSHHHTLDELDFDFQGTCTYTLMKYCGNDPTLVPFSIEAKNDIRGAINTVSYVAEVTIHMYGRTISMRRSDYPDIRVDDVRCCLPYFSPGGELQVVRSGLVALLTAECGLQVSFDWIWLYVVTVPSSYYGNTCGLCGNFNQNASDDTLDPNGNQVTDIVKWAGSWKVYDRDPLCWDSCPGNCPQCDESKKSLYSSNQFCGLISNATGPFRDCHSTVQPHKFFDNCLYDVCMNGGAKTVLCQALGSYASTCLKNNARVANWRTPSGCRLPCPVNSHYEACGNACPASCVDRTATERCTAPCTETCQCDNGYVLSGGDCVAVANCGCSSGGMYYKPNEDFWADDNCGRRCTCDPTIGIVVCRTAKCRDSERCRLVDGIRRCFPTSFATCSALRDSHYLTFDGKHFDFMGNCIYQLFGLTSDDPTHPSCRVTVKKNNRGNSAVSYTKDMTLEIYGMSISMTKDHPGKIQVDGVLTSLPFYSAGKTLIAFCSGDCVTIKTTSDLTFRYYWNGRITVTMPSTYNNEVSGLCGNSNGDAEDDFTMKDGNLAPSAVEFGESWKVRDVPGCTSECTENCLKCSEEEDRKYKTAEYCGIINKPNGPFSQCYDTVDATTYFIDCVSDTCQKRGDPSIMCSAISAYVIACQEKGIQIQEWRTRQFCNPVCPESRHYELCGRGCADTCYGLAPPTGCDEKCKEGCFCNSGSILSGDQCVRIADCGCTHMDRYYPSGQDFYPDDSCQERCWCTGNGVADCVKTSCGANEECKVVKGVQGCHPSGYGTCAVTGASHYLSFDHRSFDFQGTCTYTLATICSGQSGHSFSVVVENQRLGSTHAAVTKLVSVSVHDQHIIMERGLQWRVKVNGEQCNLPLTLSDGNVTINQEGIHKVLRTLDGMMVLYDSMNYLQVKVPSTSKGKMCGLCGNFNGDPSDDLLRLDGKTTENVDEFAASWKVAGKGPTCTDGCGSRCPDCGEEETAPFKTDTKCGMITAREGPFRNCHHLVSPTLFYSSCLYDMCAATGTQGALCSSLQAYVAACQDAGADIQAWREAASCPLSCPAHSHYKINTYTCDFTCSALRGQREWRDQSYEGCECDAGYAFDGDTCVPGNDCGCLYKGRYQKGNDSFVMPMCGERCFCGLEGNVVCALLTCGLDSTCGIRNGVIGCYRTHANCTISKGRDFISFDNKEGEMALPGAFDMAFVCDVNSKDWFRVVVDVQECNPGSVRTLVHVFFKNAFIAVNDKGDAWLIGRPLPTPVVVNGVITVFKSQEDLIIEEKGKVRLAIGPNGSVEVQAWDTFASLLCGACGNYNENPDDDLRLSGGGSASDTTQMINSWKAPDFSACV